MTTQVDVVREGHFKTVEYMNGPDFRKIKEILDAEVGGYVYFRPLDKGVRLVDLSAGRKPRTGIGPILQRGTSADRFIGDLDARLTALRAKQENFEQVAKENVLEAELISEAQKSGLEMSQFEGLLFIHSQWRVDRPGGESGSNFTDLLAVDPATSGLVIIELKLKQSQSADDQACRYLRYFQDNWDGLHPFFEKVAETMGTLYGCPELAGLTLDAVQSRAVTAWPKFDDNAELVVRMVAC